MKMVRSNIPIQPPSFPVISNVTGEEVTTRLKSSRAQDQVTGTVVARLHGAACRAWVRFFIELAGRSAAAIAAYAQDVEVMSVADADQFASALRNCRSEPLRMKGCGDASHSESTFVRNPWKLRCHISRKLLECARVLASLFRIASTQIFCATAQIDN